VSSGEDGATLVWNLELGGQQPELAIRRLPGQNFAVLSPDRNQILTATDDAWRWLGWIGPHPITGEVTRLPAETFGPVSKLVIPV
jgi:hypothetical protein